MTKQNLKNHEKLTSSEITREQRKRLARAIKAIIMASQTAYPENETNTTPESPSKRTCLKPINSTPSTFAKRRNFKRLSIAV